ncbi:MAG: RnfABCDGE type electron transport complex subunit D [Ruminococcaceae bacterium]|nr:RnfABCDGE type electron transport complex subunit D [Oscillospiraceae bacterium]
MELKNKLTVNASPHVGSADTTTGIMLDVIIALIPAGIASVFIFGARTLAVIAVAVITAVLAEFLSRKAMKREQTIGDLSAAVTGLLLAYNLPSNMPLWQVALGSIIAIVVVKQMFGGIGQNFVNPALLARIVLMSAFPGRMSAATFAGLNKIGWDIDAVTGATPMGLISLESGLSSDAPSLIEMFLGTTSGCLGEVSAIALLIGGLYLIIRKVISPIIPVAYIGTVALISIIAFKGDFNAMIYEVLGGGLIIGAFFMATDYTTSPITKSGKWIYAIGAGLITCIIRLFGSLPEGVSFSIIIMNIFTPHIESLTAPKPFGYVKPEKKKKEKKAKEKEEAKS